VRAQLVIPAAGMGTRLGSPGPKALLDLESVPLLVRTLARFEASGLVRDAIIAVPPEHREEFKRTIRVAYPEAHITLVDGGAERQDSVRNGLDALDGGCEVVLIHDAARPFVAHESIEAVRDAADEHGAATVAVPVVDTILRAGADAFLEDTPERSELWACQTPQAFRLEVIRDAHARARDEAFMGTDDASLVRRIGAKVKLVMGTPLNIKVTTPGDLALARQIIQGKLV
jgi:2-C-methyl-D-erythritol 4-phosphate cytidylyltransferase